MTNFNAIKVNLALLGAVALWSLSFVAIRIGLDGYSPGSLALLRLLIASICLGMLFKRQATPMTRLTLRHFKLLVGVGAIGISAYSILLNSGEKTISSSLASFVVAQTPVITATFAIAFLNERPSFITICGIIVSCVGIGIIVLGQPLHVDFNLGLILVISATFCGSLYTIFQKHLLADLSPFHVTAFSTWVATIALLVFLPELVADIGNAPLEATGAVIFLGMGASTFGQWLWTYGLSKTMVVRATSYLYAMPIISTTCGWLLLSEIPSASALLGGMIALLGAILVKKELA